MEHEVRFCTTEDGVRIAYCVPSRSANDRWRATAHSTAVVTLPNGPVRVCEVSWRG